MVDKVNVLEVLNELKVDIQPIVTCSRECSRLKREQQRYLELKSSLYRDWKEGILSKDDFLDLKKIYKEKYISFQKMIEQQERKVQELLYTSLISSVQLEELKKRTTLTQINREVLIHFIERIIVYEDKRLCVEFRYQESFDRAR